MRFVTFVLLVVLTYYGYANDGAFYAQGNQLIPIVETTVSVQREILRIEKTANDQISVSVYYEFFNPGPDKKILTGFEALSPHGDVDGTPVQGKHPYMSDFSVRVNGVYLSHNVAIVKDSLYYQDGQLISIPETALDLQNVNDVDFYYVYYFEPLFKKGINIVEHTYNVKLSGSIELAYDFSYVLTAANRWSNKQVDDFTLIIDMGDFQEFYVLSSFFKDYSDWIISGIGKSADGGIDPYLEKPSTYFAMQSGELILQQKNFIPKGELFLYTFAKYSYGDGFNYKIGELPFSPEMDKFVPLPIDEISKKILRNLPFARRGYVFKNETIQAFFETQNWYAPNPGYEAKPELLPQSEQDWIKKFSN